jgi:hypothetical protein
MIVYLFPTRYPRPTGMRAIDGASQNDCADTIGGIRDRAGLWESERG